MISEINEKDHSCEAGGRLWVSPSRKYREQRRAKPGDNPVLGTVVYLYELNNDRPRITINKLFSLFKAKYDITRWDNNVFEFRTKSFWKSQYECQVGQDAYMIYGHRGRKYSIYKNDNQIAWWDKNAVSWFAGDNYKIITNRDADVDLLISLCLIVDNFSSDSHDGNMVNIDFGNIGFQARKFDPSWQPQ